jgi:hypothetical protein
LFLANGSFSRHVVARISENAGGLARIRLVASHLAEGLGRGGFILDEVTCTGINAKCLAGVWLECPRAACESLVGRDAVGVVARFGLDAGAVRLVGSRHASVWEGVEDVDYPIAIIVPLAHQGVPARAEIDVSGDIAVDVYA